MREPQHSHPAGDRSLQKTFTHPRTIPHLDHGSELFVRFKHQSLLNLASNNYLGLAGLKELNQGAIQAIEEYGTSASASRLISGTYALYDRLEERIRQFKNTEAALAVGSGYAANLCLLIALARRNTCVFSDRLNHASINDGIRISRARHIRYRHLDTDHLLHLLKKYAQAQSKIIVTDSVFSMDGDTAPLEELARLARDQGALLMVDEAHATGIFGQGRGLAGHLGLEQDIHVHMGTFSKALGSYGGYIASSREIIDLVINRGRAFIFSTALPPAVVGASLAALDMVAQNPGMGAPLLDMAQELREHLNRLGFDTGQSTSQIIPVILGSSTLTLKARDRLMDLGLFTAAVRPPAVPDNTSRLRISLRLDLKQGHMLQVKKALETLAREVIPG